MFDSVLTTPPPAGQVRRTVFISHSHLHESETNQFLKDFQGVFISRHIGVSNRDDFIESTDPDYVMRQIREKHIGTASVTIILVGSCTHSRRYVDWEIKASLQQGKDRLPNGLLAIRLPSCPNGAFLPPRLEKNLRVNDLQGYSQYPRSPIELRRWIEEAFQARRTIADRILNPNDMMVNNAKCRVCGVWELAELAPAIQNVREDVLDRWGQREDLLARALSQSARGLHAATGLNARLAAHFSSRTKAAAERVVMVLENPQGIEFSCLAHSTEMLSVL